MLSIRLNVRSTDAGIAEALRWHLEPFLRPRPEHQAVPVEIFPTEDDAGSDPPVLSYFRGQEFGFKDPSPTAVLNHAIWDLHAFVAREARDFVFLHAGAVIHDGRALLLPAQMDHGKSSLVTALLARGFGYLSDELGAIDPVTGHAYPFPKRISLDADSLLRHFPDLEGRLMDRSGTSAGPNQRYVRPEDLGASVGAPAPIGWLVFVAPERDGPPRLEEISSARAVEDMAANCFNLYRYADRGVILLARVARDAQAYVLSGGTPKERAALLAERLS